VIEPLPQQPDEVLEHSDKNLYQRRQPLYVFSPRCHTYAG